MKIFCAQLCYQYEKAFDKKYFAVKAEVRMSFLIIFFILFNQTKCIDIHRIHLHVDICKILGNELNDSFKEFVQR